MRILEYFWYRIRPAHLVLFPLSLLFGAISAIRRALYRRGRLQRFRLAVPVVVVGNISVGGTGKTPVVLWLCNRLRALGFNPGVIARGYGGSERLQEVRAESRPAECGDEALLVALRSGAPVFVASDRVAAARALLAAHPSCNVIVSDDGLQHYRLARDLELVVVDGERAFGNGLLLPAGPLREPVKRLREVDAIVLNGETSLALEERAVHRMRLVGRNFINLVDPNAIREAATFVGQVTHAIAGIGNPERFFAHLRALQIEPIPHPFPDHFAYGADDLAFVGNQTLLMTEKDAVKCAPFARENWWYLPVEAHIEPALDQLLLTKLKPAHGR